jgi:hypothetical protein
MAEVVEPVLEGALVVGFAVEVVVVVAAVEVTPEVLVEEEAVGEEGGGVAKSDRQRCKEDCSRCQRQDCTLRLSEGGVVWSRGIRSMEIVTRVLYSNSGRATGERSIRVGRVGTVPVLAPLLCTTAKTGLGTTKGARSSGLREPTRR